MLFQQVMAQVPGNIGLAAGLMGVSVPTMKRRLSSGETVRRVREDDTGTSARPAALIER